MKWLINFLKWQFAGKELSRLYRLETDMRECRRWLSGFEDVAMTLDNIASRNGVKGGFNVVRPIPVDKLRELLRVKPDWHDHADSLACWLGELLDITEEPPEKNCSCFISPPCNDCVDNAHPREVLENARESLSRYAKSKAGVA